MDQAQQAQLQQQISQVQAQIDQYNQLRSATTRHLKSLDATKRQQAMALLQKWRDPALEEQAINTIRDLRTTMLGREPTPQELAQGLKIDPGMGNLGLNLAVGATVLMGGLVALSGLYQTLFGRESYLQQELGITSAGSLANKAFHASVWLAAMGAAGFGAYKLFEKVAK